VGGAFVGLLGALRGELTTFDIGAISMRSFLAWAYLLVFGSLIAFTAFVYLLRVSTPARVATYAYVNPVVAVLLGWTFGGESISGRMLVAAAIIVGGVAIITAAEGRTPQQSSAPGGRLSFRAKRGIVGVPVEGNPLGSDSKDPSCRSG
jgi:drug/metabolite transporter (DMT)-like permease